MAAKVGLTRGVVLLLLVAVTALVPTASKPGSPPPPPPQSQPVAGARHNVSAVDLSVSEFMQHMLSRVVQQQKNDVTAMRSVELTCSEQEASYEAQLSAFNAQIDQLERAIAAQNSSLRQLPRAHDLDAKVAAASTSAENLRTALGRARALFHVSKNEEREFNRTISELYEQLQAQWNKYQDAEDEPVAAAPHITNTVPHDPSSVKPTIAAASTTSSTTTATSGGGSAAGSTAATGGSEATTAAITLSPGILSATVTTSGIGSTAAVSTTGSATTLGGNDATTVVITLPPVVPSATVNRTDVASSNDVLGLNVTASGVVNASNPLNEPVNASWPSGSERLALENSAISTLPNGTASTDSHAGSFLELQTHVFRSRTRARRHSRVKSPLIGGAPNVSSPPVKTFVVQQSPRMITPTIVSSPTYATSNAPSGLVVLERQQGSGANVASAPSGGIATQEIGNNVVAFGTVSTVDNVPSATLVASSSNDESRCMSSCMPSCNTGCLNTMQTSPVRVVTATQSVACESSCMPECNPTCGAIQAPTATPTGPGVVFVSSRANRAPVLALPPSSQSSPPKNVVASVPVPSSVDPLTQVTVQNGAASVVGGSLCAPMCMPSCASACVSRGSQPSSSQVPAGGSVVISGPAVVTVGGTGGTSVSSPSSTSAVAPPQAPTIVHVRSVAHPPPPPLPTQITISHAPATTRISVSGARVIGASAPPPTAGGVVAPNTAPARSVAASAFPRFAEVGAAIVPADISNHDGAVPAVVGQAQGMVGAEDHRRLAQRTRTTREGSLTVSAADASQAQQFIRSSASSMGGGEGAAGDIASSTQVQSQQGVVVHAQHREVVDTFADAESHQIAMGGVHFSTGLESDVPGRVDGSAADKGQMQDQKSEQVVPIHVGHAVFSGQPLAHGADNAPPSASAVGKSGHSHEQSINHIPATMTNLRDSLGKLVNSMDSLVDEAADNTGAALDKASHNSRSVECSCCLDLVPCLLLNLVCLSCFRLTSTMERPLKPIFSQHRSGLRLCRRNGQRTKQIGWLRNKP